MSVMEAAVIVLTIGMIMLTLRVYREIQHRDLAERAFVQKLDVLESKVKLAEEEITHKDLVTNARVNVLERRMAAYEAPDPFETIMDEEEEDAQ